jgi:hypothetical protein
MNAYWHADDLIVKRALTKLFFLPLLLLTALVGFQIYRAHHSVEAQLQAQQEKTAELQSIVERLSSEHRIADVLVTDQRSTPNGTLRTTLLFVEYDRHGDPLAARQFVIDGQMVHIDALVVKFEGKFVEENDSLRGHSVALFTRIYGDHQSPDSADQIDPPGQVPPAYRAADSRVSSFETKLWSDFWRLADDSAYRQSLGVRVAQGEGVWRPFQPGYLYTVTLESNGGLNITSEKVRGIYSELLPKK